SPEPMAAPTAPSLPTHASLVGLTAGYVRVKRAERQPVSNLNVPHSSSLRCRLKVEASALHMVSLSGPLPGSPPTERLFLCRHLHRPSARFRHGWRGICDGVSAAGANSAA